jgi:hypothetical protein
VIWAITLCRPYGPSLLRVSVLCTAAAIAGCTQSPSGPAANDEFTYRTIDNGAGLVLITDTRTTCEYIVNLRGGITLRSDGFGNETPNCAGSHGYASNFPYAKRPDQQVKP